MNCMTLLSGTALQTNLYFCTAAKSRLAEAWDTTSTTPPKRCS